MEDSVPSWETALDLGRVQQFSPEDLSASAKLYVEQSLCIYMHGFTVRSACLHHCINVYYICGSFLVTYHQASLIGLHVWNILVHIYVAGRHVYMQQAGIWLPKLEINLCCGACQRCCSLRQK